MTDTTGARLGAVAERHRFDTDRLLAWMRSKGLADSADLAVTQFVGGASNPTFLVTTDAGRFVLRKKPPGPLLASAHQVDREYRVMAALRDTGVPVPVMRALCDDDVVIGTPFYVMDYLEGRIFRDAALPDLTRDERAAVYDQLNAALAALHRVDYRAVGLEDYGRPTGYFERQIARWTKQYRGAESETIPAMEALIAELPARVPASDDSAITHGDYRLENVMFHPTEPRLIAVLDWELSTIGHPLADIAYNCFMWHSRSTAWGTLVGVDFAASGIPSERDYLAAYLARTGRGPVEDWAFYLGFSVFRLASISQGVYARALAGTTPNAGDAVNGCPQLAEQALALLRGEEIGG